MKLAVAFLISALSFPGQFNGEFPPKPPAPEKIAWEDGSWFHNMKNLTTETVRADAEFWSKALLFVILVQFVIIVWLIVV